MWATPPPPAPGADLHAAPHAAKDPLNPDDEADVQVLGPAPEVAHAQGGAAGGKALAAAAAPGKANGRAEATAVLSLLGWQKRAAKACRLLIL